MIPDQNSIQSVRGAHDLLPERAALFLQLEEKARSIFSLFGFKEIRTPILEPLPLFVRALGQTTDIVEKEMFVLKDRGDRFLCLRPEGTAGVVRAYIENHLAQKSGVTKLFYVGAMFRAERPQGGRFREFHQIGTEAFGNDSAFSDVETIQVVSALLKSVGVKDFEVQLNSLGCEECRPNYQKKLLDFLQAIKSELCEDCQKRMEKNPLRALDCKIDRDKLLKAPQSLESLCGACLEHHKQVMNLFGQTDIPHRVVSQLVRGLDYYTRTVFEVYALGKMGSQDALAAGGRYDRLVEELGGGKVPAVGFALGMERLLNLLPELAEKIERKGTFIIALGESAKIKAFQILNDLREKGIPAQAVFNNQSLKSQMRLADSLNLRFCLILGDNELKEDSIMVKDLELQSQKKVSLQELVAALS